MADIGHYTVRRPGNIRQLHYSEKNEKSIDVGLFLNGIPGTICTVGCGLS